MNRARANAALQAGHRKQSSGCWEWQRATMNSGYGRIYQGFDRDMSAHKGAYLTWVGEVPEGLCVLHRCDNRICINPSHLFLGTKADNSRDMVAKGRQKCPARARTHCPRGHQYDGINSKGARICSICHRAAVARFKERKPA